MPLARNSANFKIGADDYLYTLQSACHRQCCGQSIARPRAAAIGMVAYPLDVFRIRLSQPVNPARLPACLSGPATKTVRQRATDH